MQEYDEWVPAAEWPRRLRWAATPSAAATQPAATTQWSRGDGAAGVRSHGAVETVNTKRDPALDYEGSSSKMGKNNGDDFYEGKVTLPVILALKTADRKEKDFWKKTFNKKVRNKTDLRIAKKIIKDKDTINQTLTLANKYGEEAKNIMKDFESNPVRNALIDLVDFSLIRNY